MGEFSGNANDTPVLDDARRDGRYVEKVYEFKCLK